MKNKEIQRTFATIALAASLVGCSGEAANNSQPGTSPELNAVPTLTVDPESSQQGEYDNIPGLIPYYNIDAVSAIKLMSPDEQERVYDILTIEHPHLKYNVAVLNFNKGQNGEMNIPVGRLFVNGMGAIIKHEGKYIFATNAHVLQGNYENRDGGFFLNPGVTIVIPGVGAYSLPEVELQLLGGTDDSSYYVEFSEDMQRVLSAMEANRHAVYLEVIDTSLYEQSKAEPIYYYDVLADEVVPVMVDAYLPDSTVHVTALTDIQIDSLGTVGVNLPMTYSPNVCDGFSGTAGVRQIEVDGVYRLFYIGGLLSSDNQVVYKEDILISGKNPECTPIDPDGISPEIIPKLSAQPGAGITYGLTFNVVVTQ